jgi:hypothetical protein
MTATIFGWTPHQIACALDRYAKLTGGALPQDFVSPVISLQEWWDERHLTAPLSPSPGGNMSAQQLPQYKCHKIVRAAQIVSIAKKLTRESAESDQQYHDSTLSLSVPDSGEITNLQVEVNAAWMAKHQPQEGGYYVVYANGYDSFSPTAAFEDGYTLITPSTFRSRLLEEHAELQTRVQKLEAFFGTPVFDGLPEIDRSDLRIQRICMRDYLKVLDRRVSRLCNDA